MIGRLAAACALVFAALFVGCTKPTPEAAKPKALAPELDAERVGGDWNAITEHGTIRFSRRRWDGFETLRSQGLSTEEYRRLAERFADRHGLAVAWHVVPTMDALLESVEGGLADIAVHNVTVLPGRQDRVAFSLPLTRSQEWVVGVREDGRFGVAVGTAYVESLARHYPDAPTVAVPADAEPLDFADLIEAGELEATIMDEAAARTLLRASPDLKKLRELPESHEHAWALNKEATDLKEVLDRYLRERHSVEDEVVERRDWDAIKTAGRLRMLTVNQPTTYYLWRGELLGYEYEMVRLFATAHDLELEVIVEPNTEALLDGLVNGHGDVVAAGLTPTLERESMGIRFTEPYMKVREVAVTAGPPISDVDGLDGRQVFVNPATTYAATLTQLAPAVPFQSVTGSTESILDEVAAGRYDATVADSHFAELAATFDEGLLIGPALTPETGLAWAVRADDIGLKQAFDVFIGRNVRGYDFNVLYHKYFVNERRMGRQREHRITADTLSPFDNLIRTKAKGTGFDWKLIVAQMYQESGFDPSRVSFAGARGLMQVLPSTAEGMGVDPDRLHEPEVGIAAGIDYLAWTRARFPRLSPGEQLWFALAAYNAGAGHVMDGRRLAKRLGLNPSLWFGNVEQAMLKLSEPEYARQAVHGYVRGTEVVGYVGDIRKRFEAYVAHFDSRAGGR